MADTLMVEVRDTLGTRSCRKLRAEGRLPAVLYGRGEETVPLTVRADELRGVLRHGGKVVQLAGAESGQALVQATQWDTFGSYLLHLDLVRVVAGEAMTVEVEVELKGEAVGVRDGGLVEQLLRAVVIEAPPAAIPDRLFLDVSELPLNGSLPAGEVSGLPAGAKLVTDAAEAVVHCVPPADEPDLAEASAGTTDPEVIGAKEKEGGGE